MKHNNSNCSTLLEAFRDGRPGKYLSILLVFAFLNTLGGCYYYKVVTSEEPPPVVISTQQEAGKFIILHSLDQAWKFSNIRVGDDAVVGKITPLQGHEYYKTNPREYSNRFKVRSEKSESDVINEVHITISAYSATEGDEISIALENIEKIEIYDWDTGTTSASFIFGQLGVLSLLFVAILAIAIANVGD